MLKKRSNIINLFNKKNIITKSEKFFEAPEKITESVTDEKSRSINSNLGKSVGGKI